MLPASAASRRLSARLVLATAPIGTQRGQARRSGRPRKWRWSDVGYEGGMANAILDLWRRGIRAELAEVVAEARELIGWSQRELADRSKTSHTTVWRIETGSADHLDLVVVDRILTALGIRASLQLNTRHLEDRRRQRDAVHARLTGYVARRLQRAGWLTSTEVAIGDEEPRGWIDLLAFREADAALLVEESKTELPDMGAMQRTVAFYEREAARTARQLGWRPRTIATVVIVLDSAAVASRLGDNRDLAQRAFPTPPARLQAWIDRPGAPAPSGWTMAMVDPARRQGPWLRPTPVSSRRRTHAYANYADAAARLRLRR